MRWSPEKLRWLSLSGAVLLAVAVAAFFGLARYTRGKVWQRILARNGVTLTRESKSITYSQSVGGRTVFTIHAARSVPHGSGQWTLQDAVLILYGKDGRNDRVSGNQFEYDQNAGVLRAMGEVHMDLEAPRAAGKRGQAAPALGFGPDDETAEDPSLIHVRTSGLVYMRKLGVAATKELTEFKYQGMTCTSLGAEFDSGQDVLRLLADVRLTGTVRKSGFTLTASRADLDRTADTAEFTAPRVDSGKRSAQAAHAVLHLRRDGSLDHGTADGDVQMVSGTSRTRAPEAQAEFDQQDRVKHAILSGGVMFEDTDPARASKGSAQTVDLRTSGTGALARVVGNGGVHFVSTGSSASGVATRALHAEQAIALFVPVAGSPKRSILHVLQMTGAAEFSGQSAAKSDGPGSGLTRVSADELTTTFSGADARQPQPEQMVGQGHTQLQQTGADGRHQTSTGDGLDVRFAQRPGSSGPAAEVSSAIQTGHVVVHSWPGTKAGASAGNAEASTGYAQQAVYVASEGGVTLTGRGDERAEVEQGSTQLQAPSIVLYEGTGDAEASGGVIASTGGEGGASATHVLAARARLSHGSGVSEFDGTDADPAQLWQAGSQVRAAKIVLDGKDHSMSARPAGAGGSVNAVFASASGGPGSKAKGRSQDRDGRATNPDQHTRQAGNPMAGGAKLGEASRDAVEIRAAAMDYNDLQRQATFNGGIVMRDPAGEVTGTRAAAFLEGPPGKTPSPAGSSARRRDEPGIANVGGRLERMVVIGDVRVVQPGRTATGEQLTYTAASNNFVLTGTPSRPPRVQDVQQGVVTGATLVFGAADSSIVVAGAHASGEQSKPTRVHTETDIRQH